MSNVQSPIPTSAFPDRSLRLTLCGILQIVLGCFCGLTWLMMIAVAVLGPMPGTPEGAMTGAQSIPVMAYYFVLAVGIIWLGVGSIRARRWAWTLTVVLSWMWLVMGVFACVGLVFAAGPMMRASMEQQAKVPPEVLVMIQIVVGVAMACIYILLPAVFLLFYHRESVRATCQRRDPHIPWTDRCPMPVLALSLLLALFVVSMSGTVVYGCVVPLCGTFVSGPAGAAVILVMTLVLAYLAWGSYRLQMAAWWGMLLLCILGTANTVVTFSQVGLMEMYEKMQMPAAQLEMMKKSGMIEIMSRWMPWAGLVGGLVWVGYLLYVRRYFAGSVEGRTGDGRAS